MRMIELLRNLSLRQKLIVSSILCLIVPTLITLGVSSYTTKDVLKEQAVANSLETLNIIERFVENRVNRMIYISNYIQFDEEIRLLMMQYWNEVRLNVKTDEAEQFMRRKRVTEKLENISFPDEKTYITILLPDGTNYTNYSYYEYKPALFFQESWFPKLEDLPSFSTFWIGTHEAYLQTERQRGEQFISMVKPMKSFSSEPYGYIIVSIGEDQINRVFAQERANEEKMMLDSSGTILSHVDKRKIGSTFPYMKGQLSESGPTTNIVRIGREEYLVVASKVSYADWYLLSMTPYQTALGKINTILRTNFVVQIIFFTIFLFILVTLVRQFTKPIVNLGRTVSKVEAGNLDVRSHIRGPDEIGRLGRSFDKMLDRIQEMIRQITLEQSQKRKAELEMLQAQINPHFLFNILNSIRMKIMLKGDEESASLISSLAILLRMTINRSNELIPLREEVETVVHYLKLMNFRHSEKIELEVRLSPESVKEEVPRFFMQPLIENAVIHGFHRTKGTIRILSWMAPEQLIVIIEDDGKGMEVERLRLLRQKLDAPAGEPDLERREGFSGIGLKNVYDRMKLIYGNAFHADIESRPDEGTKIKLCIPKSERSEPHV